ncbi:15740_t:CDS:2 [Acaulospora morrowiae]|uniref:15740_t:CDS:1 n=1 Tax=Acaulospora morrowiae TaxID=94023 RepID=A0A9N9AU20_9GLOM|nr:15740_t:CDS:2 [Acaulospora morrowiae]
MYDKNGPLAHMEGHNSTYKRARRIDSATFSRQDSVKYFQYQNGDIQNEVEETFRNMILNRLECAYSGWTKESEKDVLDVLLGSGFKWTIENFLLAIEHISRNISEKIIQICITWYSQKLNKISESRDPEIVYQIFEILSRHHDVFRDIFDELISIAKKKVLQYNKAQILRTTTQILRMQGTIPSHYEQVVKDIITEYRDAGDTCTLSLAYRSHQEDQVANTTIRYLPQDLRIPIEKDLKEEIEKTFDFDQKMTKFPAETFAVTLKRFIQRLLTVCGRYINDVAYHQKSREKNFNVDRFSNKRFAAKKDISSSNCDYNIFSFTSSFELSGSSNIKTPFD